MYSISCSCGQCIDEQNGHTADHLSDLVTSQAARKQASLSLVLVVVRSPHPSFLVNNVVALVVLYGSAPHEEVQQATPHAGNIGLPFSRNTSRIDMSVRRDRSCQWDVAR